MINHYNALKNSKKMDPGRLKYADMIFPRSDILYRVCGGRKIIFDWGVMSYLAFIAVKILNFGQLKIQKCSRNEC